MTKDKKITITNILCFIVLITSIIYFVYSLINGNNVTYVSSLIGSLLLVLFSLIYIIIIITSKRKDKKILLLGNVLLICFFTFSTLNTMNIINLDSSKRIMNFTGKSLSSVIDWSTKNNVELETIYEYSDMVDEYYVISQDVSIGTKLKDVKKLTLAISDGANPYKELIIPSMVSWDSEKVLNYIEENHLSNVIVEFVSSEKAVNTVIEQSVSGTVRRNDEIRLTFSYGKQRDYEEVKLIDFTNLSKFRAEFYLKQYNLRYELLDDFSKSIKQGNVMSQDINPGKSIKIDDEKIKLTISKGPKIKVPDLSLMSTTEITNWIMKNKLKLKLTDRYDENVDLNKVIEANYKSGDIISQGTLVEIVLSKGQLMMRSFNSLNEFREWADKYNIKYEEIHEFSESAPVGEVISYSYKNGDIIKNDEAVIIKISDGKKLIVPDLTGLTKNKISSKLDSLGLNYNFVYASSNTVDEGLCIKQSISSGSEVTSGTTITITISSGKKKQTSNNNNNNSNTTKNENNTSSNNNNSTNNDNKATSPTPTCDKSIGSEINIQAGDNANQTKSMLQQLNPNHTFNFTTVSSCPNGDSTPGTICNLAGLDGTWKNYCDTIDVTIVK